MDNINDYLKQIHDIANNVFQIGFAIVTNKNNVDLMFQFTARIDDQSATGNDSFNSQLRFT